ncbi:hypothetical protein SUGI_0998730 [Cryptomeria japonica]|uniref:protein SUPPRESSOR OF GENE SILENCING 3 homolog n=1 Tax=Cryptomeria japonica TaxID=3369 RepID=UPI002414C27A|nr:protein SUPPRESSOR OF GENE SILENCING 3 homolog [Cryptomeria japonica]XP_057864808.2 protein SUPPRESSOR OF GENE SILENCING 3 homolog [Cryptomeria japonica]GLJ47297.1 hypothetical protein SUGI_0998730 [Cryptomeria japonica]
MSSFQQNDDGWEVASSRKARNPASSSANRQRGGASYSSYAPERPGVGFSKGKAGYNPNGDGQKSGRRGDNSNNVQDHGYKQPGWRETGKTQPKNGNATTVIPTTSRNGGDNMNQAWQSQPKPEAWDYAASARVGVQDTGARPSFTNSWQGGIRNSSTGGGSTSWSSVVASAAGKGEGSGGANGSGGNSVTSDKVMSTLLPFEQSGEPSQSEAGNQSSEGESEIEHLDSDEDLLSSDGFDSDGADVSHETKKKNKWFKSFFESLDSLSIEQINEPERQWHCPACQGGVGAIDWYRGMQPILTHAKTVRSKRVKLHRKLAEVLEEELNRRGAHAISEEMFGKWKGLRETVNDREIVWPPIVIIQNTILDQDENEQWIGMGNKELLEYFKGYKAMKARHAYGPKGHRGMSVLIFEESGMGYMEAERLHRHFLKEKRGKEEWERHKVLFHPGGQRILYGYLATKEEMEIFNRHSKGKQRLKYDMRSHHQMVVESMKQMNEDNQKLTFYKTKVAKEQEHSKTLEETVYQVSSKLRLREAEVKVIRQRATEQHEESKKEMDYLEQSYRHQIDQLNEAIAEREQELEKVQEEFKISHLDRCHQLQVDSAKLPKDKKVSNDKQHEEQIKIDEEIERHRTIVESSVKDSEEYERERQELIKVHDKRRKEIKLRQLQEEVAFEKELEQQRVKLLEKYAKKREEASYTPC